MCALMYSQDVLNITRIVETREGLSLGSVCFNFFFLSLCIIISPKVKLLFFICTNPSSNFIIINTINNIVAGAEHFFRAPIL